MKSGESPRTGNPGGRMTHQWRSFKTLKARSEEEWISKIATIQPKELRMKVAAIIWWDWFAAFERKAPELREIIKPFKDYHHYPEMEEELCYELIRLGYRSDHAKRRAKIPLR